MKKIIITLAFVLLSLTTFAQDTLSIKISDLGKLVEDVVTNSKEKQTIKYYFVYDNSLISTNKSTKEFVALCMKHNINSDLYLITSKTGRKRITKK